MKQTQRRKRSIAPLERRRRASIPRLLWFALQFMSEVVQHEMKRRGHTRVRDGHALVLRNMNLDGTPLTVLTARAGVSRQAVAKVAGSLVRLGYFEFRSDPHDRRGKIVQPTARGRKLIRDSLASYVIAERHVSRALGASGVRTLRRLLTRLMSRVAAPGEIGWAARPTPQR